MFRNILIATDGSDLAQIAVSKGLALAKALDARIAAVTVTPSWVSVAPGEAAIAFPVEEYNRAAKENASAILALVTEAANQIGVECTTMNSLLRAFSRPLTTDAVT